MPGKLLLCGQYIIWTDPLNADGQAHIVSLNTKDEIGKIVNIGNGPEEFITPFFTSSSHNKLVICDMNKDKIALHFAEENRKELETVLAHYSQKPGTLLIAICPNSNNPIFKYKLS